MAFHTWSRQHTGTGSQGPPTRRRPRASQGRLGPRGPWAVCEVGLQLAQAGVATLLPGGQDGRWAHGGADLSSRTGKRGAGAHTCEGTQDPTRPDGSQGQGLGDRLWPLPTTCICGMGTLALASPRSRLWAEATERDTLAGRAGGSPSLPGQAHPQREAAARQPGQPPASRGASCQLLVCERTCQGKRPNPCDREVT